MDRLYIVTVILIYSFFDYTWSARSVHSMFPRLNNIYGQPAATNQRNSRIRQWRHSNTERDGRGRTNSRVNTAHARSPVSGQAEIPGNDGAPALKFNSKPVPRKDVKSPNRAGSRHHQVSSLHNSAAFISSVETVIVGDTAVLHCSFALTTGAYKNGHIAWFKEPVYNPDRPLAKGSRVYSRDRRLRVLAIPHSALSVLIIQRAHPRDQGKYRCSMSYAKIPNQFVILNVTRNRVDFSSPQFLHDGQFTGRRDTQALELGSTSKDSLGVRKEKSSKESQHPTKWVIIPQAGAVSDTSAGKAVQPERVHEYRVSAGSRLSIKCSSHDDSRYRVFWSAKHENGTSITFDDGSDSFWGNELVIGVANSSKHAGIYTCTIQHPSSALQTSRNFNVIVEDRPWPISLFVQGFNIDLMLNKLSRHPRFGRSVLLRCESGGIPRPKITWYKDGALLKRSRKLRIRNYTPSYRDNSSMSKVVIRHFMPNDQGRYACRVVNTNGFRERDVTLRGTYTRRTRVKNSK